MTCPSSAVISRIRRSRMPLHRSYASPLGPTPSCGNTPPGIPSSTAAILAARSVVGPIVTRYAVSITAKPRSATTVRWGHPTGSTSTVRIQTSAGCTARTATTPRHHARPRVVPTWRIPPAIAGPARCRSLHRAPLAGRSGAGGASTASTASCHESNQQLAPSSSLSGEARPIFRRHFWSQTTRAPPPTGASLLTSCPEPCHPIG